MGRTRSGGLTIIAKLSDVHEYLDQVRSTEYILYLQMRTQHQLLYGVFVTARLVQWLGARPGQFAHDPI